MRAIRNRVYGNSVTGVQIPPHPPVIITPIVWAFFYADEPFRTAPRACFQRTGFSLRHLVSHKLLVKSYAQQDVTKVLQIKLSGATKSFT